MKTGPEALAAAQADQKQGPVGLDIRGQIDQTVLYPGNGTRVIYQQGKITEDYPEGKMDHDFRPGQVINQSCIGVLLLSEALNSGSISTSESSACADGKLTPEDEKILSPGLTANSTPLSTQTPPSK